MNEGRNDQVNISVRSCSIAVIVVLDGLASYHAFMRIRFKSHSVPCSNGSHYSREGRRQSRLARVSVAT
jgi:hypothetical protein